MSTQLEVMVHLTPKFHAELAGEGVEYSWAHSKAFYPRFPVSQKRGRENFKQLVKDCTCPEIVLTKARIEKFATRARAYICAYHHLEQVQQAATEKENLDATSVPAQRRELFHPNIEQVQKDFKCNRCVQDFDRGFVHSELK